MYIVNLTIIHYLFIIIIININIFSIISIEYIEIKIPSRKEAYKFPVKRSLGVFFEGFIL